MLSIFSSKRMPVGLPEEIIELQESWNAFLLKMEEECRELIAAGAHDQLPAIIQEVRNAYQLQPLTQYNTLYALHTDNPLATDLLDHFRNKIHHVLLQWEKRLIFLQEKSIRSNSDKSYVMVSSNDDGIIFYTYYGSERNETLINR
jgi:hypothetical protein